jgi:hypothetical protein
MPKPMSEIASAQYAALIANEGRTARIRTLAKHVKEACESSEALDWSEDLASLGFLVPDTDDERDKLMAGLSQAFGTVATEETKVKRAAKARYIVETGEIAVSFRTVAPRDK